MKRIFCILMMSVLLLCSCGSQDNAQSDKDLIEINYDKISRRNNRTVLMKKYRYLNESFEYFNLKDPSTVPNWTLQYSMNTETSQPNVIFSFGDITEYYYNDIIYSQIADGEVTCIVPYDSSFTQVVTELLKRDNTLNYVYYLQKEGFKTANGYAASYWFTITHDVLDEFLYWDVGIGDTIKVDYNLNNEFEILDYTYYIVSNPYNENINYTKILTSTTTFNQVYKFPDFVYEYDTNPKAKLTITENFQKQSQTIQSFNVPTNIKLTNDEFTTQNRVFTSPALEQEWIFEENLITTDLNLYAYSVDAPELEAISEAEETKE